MREVEYSTVREGWAEYELDDGNKLKVKIVISRIINTGKTNPDGTPQYLFTHNVVNQVLVPVEKLQHDNKG